MVWIFVLLTALSYSLVMKYVLSHVSNTAKVGNQNDTLKELVTIHQSGK